MQSTQVSTVTPKFYRDINPFDTSELLSEQGVIDFKIKNRYGRSLLKTFAMREIASKVNEAALKSMLSPSEFVNKSGLNPRWVLLVSMERHLFLALEDRQAIIKLGDYIGQDLTSCLDTHTNY